MDENGTTPSSSEETPTAIPESPKPMAFTIDFNEGKSVDTQRHKTLVEKYQKRHRRGQSLSKLDDSPSSTTSSGKKHPLSANLPRKTLQSEEVKNCRVSSKRDGLSLPLKNVNSDRMTQSCTLPSIESPEVDLRDVLTPELDDNSFPAKTPDNPEEFKFVDATEFDFDKTDVLSDAGTYTLDADNYSEEQKERMSIDREFKIEHVSVYAKTKEYVESLSVNQGNFEEDCLESLSVATKMVEQWRIDNEMQEQSFPEQYLGYPEGNAQQFLRRPEIERRMKLEIEKQMKPEIEKQMKLEIEKQMKLEIEKQMKLEVEKQMRRPEIEKQLKSSLPEAEMPKPEIPEVKSNIRDASSVVSEIQTNYAGIKMSEKQLKVEKQAKSVYSDFEKQIKTNYPEAEKQLKSSYPEVEKQLKSSYTEVEKQLKSDKQIYMDDEVLGKAQKESFMRMKRRLDQRRPKSCTEEDLMRNNEELVGKPESLPFVNNNMQRCKNKLSPIVSPTQNISITESTEGKPLREEYAKTFQKIMFPSPKAKTGIGLEKSNDKGSVISVTCSGAFRSKSERERLQLKKLSLTKSEVHVEAYTDNTCKTAEVCNKGRTNLSANLVLVSENLPKAVNSEKFKNGGDKMDSESVQTNVPVGKIVNLPPPVGGISGKVSPTTKIPSPIHTSRPRSRNSSNSLNIDLSDSSLETESYLKPTQNLLNSLQQRLSLDSDHESEAETKYLNNDARNLLKKPTHMRHNSLDDRNLKISNKLEHFQNKNLIDQTYSNVLNQYSHGKIHKIQNSPNNSPIRRSSSFSTKNQINTKCSNIPMKDINLQNSPNFTRNGSIQRSSSTASIRHNANLLNRRPSVNSEHKIDRNQFGDTESSSEDDLKVPAKKKDITNTRYNRAFSLRRARLDEPTPPPKCPNTPEMRRKFQPNDPRAERAISVDRKPLKGAEIQSRYLLNITKNKTAAPASSAQKVEAKGSPKIGNVATKPAPKPQVFSRTDSGRFSVRTNVKPAMTNSQKTIRKEVSTGKKPSGPRSNSSLTSKEVEFQNWKRRKSYDPMKAAAEGKKKAELAKKQTQCPMTQSYHEANQDCDSSPSHSSSVHRSQSFHGTAALEQYISSEEEEDLTLSADEGFSPPTPSPCNLSPSRVQLRYAWKDQLLH